MSITKVLLYVCGLLILALPYLAYILGGSIGSYAAVLLFLLAIMWGLFSMRKPEQPKVTLSKPISGTESLPAQSQQLANDIMTTYIGSMYDKARFMPNFDSDAEMESMLSHVRYVLTQHDLTVSDKALSELRVRFMQAIEQGLADKKKA
ncbi:hypothetical protein [Halodesulfovibrio sp.]|uniref:hypothetical protein n=1 Tax=Halodesulfovibrio sp. TaxID=1912772 RepID=UPI0025C41940|nr:hypothetical protein [Halodesulfovibrio sp.]